jgi:hypothetical protein
MEVAISSDKCVRRHVPENLNLYQHSCENLRFLNLVIFDKFKLNYFVFFLLFLMNYVQLNLYYHTLNTRMLKLVFSFLSAAVFFYLSVVFNLCAHANIYL